MSQNGQDPSASIPDDSEPVSLGIPPVLTPLGPKIAAGPVQGDDWDAFKKGAGKLYPGIDLSALAPDDVRRWIEDIRRQMKRKGNG